MNTAGDSAIWQCPRCGTYQIDGTAEIVVPQEKPRRRALLSAATRTASDSGGRVFIKSDNVDEIIDTVPRWITLADAIDRLLLVLGDRATSFTQPSSFNPDVDYPLIYGYDSREAQELLSMAEKMGLLEKGSTIISVEGWSRFDRLRSKRTKSRQAFVAMSFAPELDTVWTEGIRRGIEASGYFKAVRIDQVPHNEKIDDRIIAEIRRSGLLVADFTGNRGGVYFEAGYAMGLGIPVIWTCQKIDIAHVHFDTRQYNHIVWTDPADLREQLANRIAATVLPIDNRAS